MYLYMCIGGGDVMSIWTYFSSEFAPSLSVNMKEVSCCHASYDTAFTLTLGMLCCLTGCGLPLPSILPTVSYHQTLYIDLCTICVVFTLAFFILVSQHLPLICTGQHSLYIQRNLSAQTSTGMSKSWSL